MGANDVAQLFGAVLRGAATPFSARQNTSGGGMTYRRIPLFGELLNQRAGNVELAGNVLRVCNVERAGSVERVCNVELSGNVVLSGNVELSGNAQWWLDSQSVVSVLLLGPPLPWKGRRQRSQDAEGVFAP